MIEFKKSNLFITDSYLDIQVDMNKDKILFFDFEFNNFKDLRPISIGICSLEQQHQFYAEFYHEDNYYNENEWVFNNVVAHLEKKQEPLIQINLNLTKFLRQFKNNNVHLLSDSEIDIDVLKALGLKLLNPVKITTIDKYVRAYIEMIVSPKENFTEFMKSLDNLLSPLEKYDDFFKTHNIMQHHALNDAKALASIMQESFQRQKERQNE